MHKIDVKNLYLLILNNIYILLILYFAFLPFGSLYNVPIMILALSGFTIIILQKEIVYTNIELKTFGLMFLCIWIPMILSLPDAVNFQESFRKTLTFCIYFLISIPVILYFKDMRKRNMFINVTGIILTLWCLDAVWQSYSGENILGYPYPYLTYRLTGVFYPKFRMGLILVILSPFYFEFIRQNINKKTWMFLLLIPYIYVIILSGNKNSWIMLFISILLYTLFLKLNNSFSYFKRKYFIASVITIICAFIVFSNIGNITSQFQVKWTQEKIDSITSLIRGDFENTGGSIKERIKIWESAIRVAKDHWINGVGPRGYRYIADEYIDNADNHYLSEIAVRSTHPHQLLLEIATETGIIGILGYVLFLVFLIKLMVKYIKNKEYFNLPWMLPVITMAFPANMHKAFYGHFTATLFWVLLTLSFTQDYAES